MIVSLQIAIGIWLGGLFLIGTVWAGSEIAGKIKINRRYGAPWYRMWSMPIGLTPTAPTDSGKTHV